MEFKKAIEAKLKEVAKKDEEFAKNLKKENKSLDKCIKYIYQEVRKMASGQNCIGLEDDEVYNLAIHYYDEDDISVDESADSGVKTAVVNDTPAETPKVKKGRKKKTEEKQEIDNSVDDGCIKLSMPLFI